MSLSTLENHIFSGKHVYSLEQQTLTDKAKLGYAAKLITGTRSVPQLSVPCETGQPKELPTGWALKQTRKYTRFSKKQREYLQRKFQIGEESGRKTDAR